MSSRNGGARSRRPSTSTATATATSQTRRGDSLLPKRHAGQTAADHAHLRANLDIWEDRLRKLPEGVSELHAFAAKNGDHQFSVRVGTGGTAHLSGEQVRQMHGAILSRNHGSGMPPTIEEAHAAFRAGAAEMRVVTPTGRYWLRPSAPAREPWSGPAFERIRSAYDRAHKALTEQQTANIRAGRLSAAQAESPANRRALAEATWRAVAADPSNRLIFGFTRWRGESARARAEGATAFARDVLATLEKREAAISRREASGASGGAGGQRRPGEQKSEAQSSLDRYVFEALRDMDRQARGAGPSGRGGSLPGTRRKPRQTKP